MSEARATKAPSPSATPCLVLNQPSAVEPENQSSRHNRARPMNGPDLPEEGAAGVVNNGRGRRESFLSSAMRTASGRAVRPTSDGRRPSRGEDSRPPLTRNLGSSMSVRVKVVDCIVYLISVNTISYNTCSLPLHSEPGVDDRQYRCPCASLG